MENVLRLLQIQVPPFLAYTRPTAGLLAEAANNTGACDAYRPIFLPNEYRMDSRQIWSGHSSRRTIWGVKYTQRIRCFAQSVSVPGGHRHV